ncbi:MAG: type II secretion system F family protein [Rhodospirillaceae bacterium]|nr:type II secretion system F family protein [Rhodospirillales bacterium]
MADMPTIVALLVLVLLGAVGTFGVVLYRLLYGSRARLKRRVQQVVGGRVGGRGGILQPRRRTLQRLKSNDDRQRWAYSLREQLRQAGLRLEVRHFLAICACLAATAWLVAWAVSVPPLAQPMAGAIIGFGLPKVAVGWRAKRRIDRFTTAFADALDIVVRGMRSGLPLGECINIIGREMPDPLGAEFRLITEGQKLGLSLQESLERAVERMPTADFRYFTIVLAIQKQTGGNLAETLGKLADLLRQRKRMRDKIKAYSSEATASAMIIGSLPLVVGGLLTLVARDYVTLLYTTGTGHVLLTIGFIMMTTGTLVMRKMINFDF